jgi:hypothetical protein
MNEIVKAEGPDFIWLIVGIFWVVAQIAGAAAKKKQQLSRPLAESGEAPGDPLAELLRKMAGAQPFDVPKPEYEEPMEEPVWAPEESEPLPDLESLRREILSSGPVEVPEIAIRPAMSSFRNSVPSIKLPAMNLSFQGSETSVRKTPSLGKILNLSDKNSLRRAMLSHIIFSPPKALEKAD